MRTLLEPGTIVRLRRYRSMRCVVETLIGSGGQGEVYVARAESESHTDRLALKWYYPSWATVEQRSVLEELTDASPPHPSFLWPIDVVEANTAGFGYLMPLRADRFVNVTEIMARRVDLSFRSMVTAGANLTHGFLCLHAQGLCYRDISFGNIFVDPRTGDVLVADNDNVGIDGQAAIGVRGTDRFMAPEVVRGEAYPSTLTDLYSLSVLLFYLFMLHHPLEGRREAEQEILDRAANELLYGYDPLFIFDPMNASNRPVPGTHDNALIFWPMYPAWFRELFVQAFTTGLSNAREGRVRETEWRAALVRLREHIVECSCRAQVFWDKDSPSNPECWSCGQFLPVPPRLVMDTPTGPETVLLTPSTSLYAYHLRLGEYGWTAPQASVSPHPEQAGVYGLTNQSNQPWTVQAPDKRTAIVSPGRTVRLVGASRIDFGRVKATVVL
jgi:DNA-binding helix-hairpin-helix protein with protein kinase domain